MITKERMCGGTGLRNHYIAHLFGWCDLSEHNDVSCEDLVHHVIDMMLQNDSTKIRYNELVDVCCIIREYEAEYVFTSLDDSFSIIETNHPTIWGKKRYYVK